MMDIVKLCNEIMPSSCKQIERINDVQALMLTLPQVDIHTTHVLHAGIYSRSIAIPAGVQLVGALIKIPTMLTISGDVLMTIGEAKSMRLTGTHVLPASAGRKQLFAANEDTTVTMSFATNAKTVEEAEVEFTDDSELLFSRRDPALNTVIITGE